MIITIRFLAALFLTVVIGWWLQAEEYGAFWLVTSIAVLRWFLPAVLPHRRDWILFLCETTLLFGGLALGFWAARSIKYERWLFFNYMHPIVRWAEYAWVISIVLGTPASYFINRWSLRRRRRGPWCPGCGYSLIGSTERRCPECGRRFTLEELRITEADLFAGSDRKHSQSVSKSSHA